MKSLLFTVATLFLTATAHAQWQNTTYTLKGGWNSIYLHGDASHATPDELFAAHTEVLEVWRWNPNPTQVGFTTTPLIPSAGTAEWTVWKSDGSVSALSQMVGQTAYLVKCSGTTSNSYSVTIPQRVMPPSASWVRNGANLMGFPSKLAGSVYPTLGSYFATFPAAIASNVKIFKYTGGELGAGNPLQVFSPSTEKLDRNQAYWFDSEVVGNFYAPVEISTSGSQGLDFARGGSVITVRLRNRSSAVSTVTITPLDSAAEPSGQETVAAGVPLIRRTLDATSGAWSETALSANASYTEVVGPQSTVELSFGINRGSSTMTSAPADAFFASLLRFTDSAGLYDISLPVTARKASLAGLWIGEASVTNVVSQAAASAGSTTAKPYPLRVLIHVDAAGQARLLSQVYLGELAAGGAAGLCLQENQLKAGTKASALRFSVAHLPLDRVIAGTGAFALGSSLECAIQIPYNDPTHPFLHDYHPDHDNKDARFEDFALPAGVTATTAKLSDGVEAPAITRACKFQFASSGGVGFGSSLVSGSYSESFTGLHQKTLEVSGTFELQRVSEIGTLTQ
ncbi:MAG: hypothetical protein RLZZ245_1424 [Verrucomicrobiota bacterium]